MKVEEYFDDDLQQKCWRFDFTLRGQRLRKKGFASETEARKVIQKLLALTELKALGLLPPEKPKVTLTDLRDAQKKDESVANKNRAMGVLDDTIKLLGADLQLVGIKRAHLRKLREYYENKKLKPGTVVIYLGYLSAALHRAPDYFEALDDWQPPPIARPQRGDGRQRVLTREELGRFFTECNRHPQYQDVGDCLRLMLLTGARRKNLMGLTYAKVNPDFNVVQITDAKNKTKRNAAISKMALEILKGRERPLLESMPEATFHWAVARVSETAGLIYGDRVEAGWVPHDLRHTAATVIETAGVKYSTVATLLGHKRRDQTATYTHTSLDDLRKAVAVLENWCRDIDGFSVIKNERYVRM